MTRRRLSALSDRPARAVPRAIAGALLACLLPVLAACAAPGAAAPPSDSPSPAGAGYPVELTNCGFDVEVPAVPQRVLAIKSTSLEMLLALGLQDRVVGYAFPDGPVPDEWAAAAADLTEVSDQVPGEEAALDLEPDLIYGGWESAFAADGVGERDELAGLGVASYVSPAACRSADVPPKLGYDEVFREIDEIGRIMGVEDRAADLVAEQREQLAAIEPDDRGLTALWYSSGTDTPYVGAGSGAPEMVLEAAGLSNIAGNIDQTWTSLGWEAIVDANPDVIVLVDATWNTAESKIALLESNPATASLDAVREHRYLTVPFAASEAGVRSVEAAASLVDQLDGLTLP